MEPFELTVDTDTIYIKIIRFLGCVLLGFFIGVISLKYHYEGTIDWLNSFTGITLSLVFAFYPGVAKRQTLIVNGDGILLKNYPFYWGRVKEYNWSSVKAIEVKKHRIELTKNIGSTSRIKLPMHTKGQVNSLKEYLGQFTADKEIAYKK